MTAWIACSARNDAGAFELNFHGEKYVPFEGAGAVNEWSLILPTSIRMFDYNTIGDVILHFDYTASYDGSHRDVVQGLTAGLVTSLKQRLSEDGITRAFSLREEFPLTYKRLAAGDTADLEIDEQHLPFFVREATVSKASLVLMSPKDLAWANISVEFDGKPVGTLNNDEQVQGFSIDIPLNGTPPWKHKIRLVEPAGAPSNVYLVMTLKM